jgi:hypothetical protein
MRLYIPEHFYRQPPQIYEKENAKVSVERSPIFIDRFFIIWKYFGKWSEAKCLMCNDFS